MREFSAMFLSFVIALSLSLSCKDNGVQPQTQMHSIPKSEIIPLSIGNAWIQETKLYDTSGVAFITALDSFCVVGDTMVGGTRSFLYTWGPFTYIYTNDTVGFQLWDGGQFYLDYKYPANRGDVYYGYTERRVVSTDTTIVTSLGSFKCYNYETTGTFKEGSIQQHSKVNYYLSPNVGWVGREDSRTWGTNKFYLYSSATVIRMRLMHLVGELP